MSDYNARTGRLQNLKNSLKAKVNAGDANAAKVLARLNKTDTLGDVDFDTVLIPESGAGLKAAVAMFGYYDVYAPQVKFIGTSVWENTPLNRESALRGSWYPALSRSHGSYFANKYANLFGERPSSLYSMGYDAVALSAALSKKSGADLNETITNPDGYLGINGAFRLLENGQNQHSLDIVEVRPGGDVIIDEAPKKFDLMEPFDGNSAIVLEPGYQAPRIFGKDTSTAQSLIYGRSLGLENQPLDYIPTAQEKEIVFHGPAEKKHIFYHNKNSNQAGELDFTYFNATYTVENALAKVKDEKGMKRVEKFLKEDICPACHGTRLSAAARAPKLRGLSLDEACRMPLSELVGWVQGVPDSLPAEMRPMAENIVESFTGPAKRLMDLGLGYLTLDRAASTLSTGERQRMQLARAVRNRTTGVLYVLDEPSIGLHPSNIVGLTGVMHDLIADGNSVILVDHDTQILKEADWIVEMGPEAGAKGGHVIAQGTIPAIEEDPASQIGPFLSGKADTLRRKRALVDALFAQGTLRLSTAQLHTVKPLEVDLPKGRLTVVTGVSGSGKTTLVLESLVPALEARIDGKTLPPHVRALDAEGIAHVKLIDATPIGINVRSTVATYAGVHDDLRRLFARSPDAKAHGYKAGDFSYNTGSLRCPGCDGTGEVSLDVQFLPDVNIPCPDCRGSRYARAAGLVKLTGPAGQTASLPELMDMDVNTAIDFCRNMKTVCQKLKVLQQLGLGYLTLGEETPSLSGGEAQRLKLASEIGRTQTDSVFVFDEPSIGLHPLDVQVLLGVFQALLDNGATVVVIEHDLDVIRNADYIIDMGPGGGDAGGRIVACGTPEQICNDPASITGRYLRR